MVKGFLVGIALLGAISGASYYEHNYTRENCQVISIENGITTFQDEVGHCWDCGTTDYELNEIVDLKMHDNYTSNNIKDDIVKEIIRVN